MLIEPYKIPEMRFAWCYRVYYRWGTHRARTQPVLMKLDRQTIASLLQPYDIHLLESRTSRSDVRLMASLTPTESVAGCAGKMKGRVSGWLREQLRLERPEKLLSRGYFACTTGATTADAVSAYLDGQGEHHGYTLRPGSPCFVQSYATSTADEERLRSAHAVTLLRFHIVLATWMRHGVFAQETASAVAECWRQRAAELRATIEKVSFVPDHVHMAISTHPSVSPAQLVVELMNVSQQMMWGNFAETVIRARVNRLWQPSAYVGSFGELESKKIGAYLRKWETSLGD